MLTGKSSIRLSRFGYYSDFIVYPLSVACLAALGLSSSGAENMIAWIMICLGSVASWTLIEYGLHRFAFHHAPFLKQLHQQHHDEERSLIGTPVWFSLLAHGLIVLLPAFLLSSFGTACAITSGVMLGYLWYVGVHHVLHHWHSPHDGYLYRLKRRHALHHHASEDCNFGVTTGIWDRAFRTAAPERLGRTIAAVAR